MFFVYISTMTIDLKTLALLMLTSFCIVSLFVMLVFIKALFKFPTLRSKLWHGITNGDMVPSNDDFTRTSQLIFAYLFGFVFVCCLFLWIAFPIPEWHYIVPTVAGVFLACIGLRAWGKH